MNLSELRLKNIVNVYGNDRIIFGITEHGVILDNHGYCANICDFIKPIPLTEEWLMKFGFEKDGKYSSADIWMGIFNQPLIQGNGYFTIPNYPLTQICYVHQLQNLYFALTEKELCTE